MNDRNEWARQRKAMVAHYRLLKLQQDNFQQRNPKICTLCGQSIDGHPCYKFKYAKL